MSHTSLLHKLIVQFLISHIYPYIKEIQELTVECVHWYHGNHRWRDNCADTVVLRTTINKGNRLTNCTMPCYTSVTFSQCCSRRQWNEQLLSQKSFPNLQLLKWYRHSNYLLQSSVENAKIYYWSKLTKKFCSTMHTLGVASCYPFLLLSLPIWSLRWFAYPKAQWVMNFSIFHA
jgi:hypothetical protein